MGIELTDKYAGLLSRSGWGRFWYIVSHLFGFLRDVGENSKLSELASFLVWEVWHGLYLQPRQRYVRFEEAQVLTIEGADLRDADFEESVNRRLVRHGLKLVPSDHAWRFLFATAQGELYGSLHGDPKCLYKSVDGGKSVMVVSAFSEPISSVYVSSNDTILVGVLGGLHRSVDRGRSFTSSLTLSARDSYIRFGKGITETPDGTLIIGEYGNISSSKGWQSCAYLYSSTDNGGTWQRSDLLLAGGVNKHVHVIRYCRALNCVFLTDGDNKKQLWIGQASGSFDVRNMKWRLVNKRHIQMGGYLSIAENQDTVLFGTDYLGGTNFIVTSADASNFVKRMLPDPYRRNPVKEMAQRRASGENEVWASLYSKIRSGTKGLLMYSASRGETWRRVVEYDCAFHSIALISDSNGAVGSVWLSVRSGENSYFVYSIAECARGSPEHSELS